MHVWVCVVALLWLANFHNICSVCPWSAAIPNSCSQSECKDDWAIANTSELFKKSTSCICMAYLRRLKDLCFKKQKSIVGVILAFMIAQLLKYLKMILARANSSFKSVSFFWVMTNLIALAWPSLPIFRCSYAYRVEIAPRLFCFWDQSSWRITEIWMQLSQSFLRHQTLSSSRFKPFYIGLKALWTC